MKKLLVIVGVLALCYGGMQRFAPSDGLCQIMFVPIGDFPPRSLQSVADYYEQTLGLHVELGPAIRIEEPMIDRRRGQLIGEELVNQMKSQLPTQANEPRLLMIGFTRGDMYIRHKDWRFAFAHREQGRFAAISTARMDPVNFGLPVDDGALVRRLIKMTSKQIGLYYYRLPERQEKTSVLFSPILGVDDLDSVSLDFDSFDRERMGSPVKQCGSKASKTVLSFFQNSQPRSR